MSAFYTGLRCLGSPATLGSIGLLLLNDHVLKAAFPSVLTGKLSDFAGLFFFPFLLAVCLGLGLDPWRVPKNYTGGLAFGLTFAWFAAIKVLPGANHLTVAWLTDLLGAPVRIVLDPTDLAALVVLWPAWRVWNDQSKQPAKKLPGLTAYLALGLAALATLATSCMTPAIVRRLVVVDQSVYAFLGNEAAVSEDGGRSWSYVPNVPDEIAQPLRQTVPLPLTVCADGDPQTCYRVNGEERLEGSQDGGQTWQVLWQAPAERRRFMQAYHDNQLGFCKTWFDPGPYDLVLLSSQEGAPIPVVAMGSEGVLVGTANGRWERSAVLRATPTLYRIEGWDLGRLLRVTLPETLTLSGAAILVLWGLSGWGWQFLRSGDPDLHRQTAGCITVLARWTLVILIIVAILFNTLYVFLLLLLPLFALLAIIFPIIAWVIFVKNYRDKKAASALGRRCFWSAAGIFPLAWSPFLLWAYGILSEYRVAQVASVVLAIMVLVGGVYFMRKGIRGAGNRAIR